MTPGRPDLRAPLFFVSYARPAMPLHIPVTRPLNNEILRFFSELSLDVSELAGSDNGVFPGFIDRQMAGGQRWSDELMNAIGTCQVFIPLVSPNMVASEWCGKEWHAFDKRNKQQRIPPPPSADDFQTTILPIKWVPFETSSMPAVVRRIQFFTPTNLPDYEIAEKYWREGLLGLLRTGQEEAYRMIVWRLAQQVVAISRTWLVEQSKPDRRKMRNIFDDSGSS